MQDIAELERRITAALERIATGIAAGISTGISSGLVASVNPVPILPEVTESLARDPAMQTADLSRLTTALDEEQMANAQLTERLRVVRNKEARLRGALEEQIADLMRQLDAQGLELSRAHRTMVQQGGQLRAMREAAELQIADPALINRTMEVEMEGLRATRSAEVAELQDILAALDPLIADEGGPDART